MMSNNVKVESISEKGKKINEIKMDSREPGQTSKNSKESSGESKKPGKVRKFFKWLVIIILILFISGAAAITADRFLFPYLASVPSLEKYEFLKPRETEVIIQEKETVKIEESDTINEAIKKIKPAIVTIIPKDEEAKTVLSLSENENFGSGFIVTSDGLIITNSQIIKDIDNKYVIFTSDNQRFDSREIYKDPASELIFLKISADNLPVVSFGEADDLRLGQKIITIGRNFRDNQNYASLGIISSLNSSVTRGLNEEQFDNMIIADSDINAKNSGGPLINLSGKVCGVNAESEDKENFVIPIDVVKKPLEDIIKNKKIERPNMGIKYISLSPQISQMKNLPKDYGVYMSEEEESVNTDGPAYEAGIRKGDIIYKIADKEISEKQNLQRILENYKVGDEVEVKYIRDKKEHLTKILLGE
jgi:serine protease Do